MRKLLTSTAAALALAGSLVAAVAPADAQRWRGGGYRGQYYRGGGSGAAVAAGIIGLGVGAAIASSNRGYRGGRYAYGYDYAPDYYYAPPPPPPPPAYYYGYAPPPPRYYYGW